MPETAESALVSLVTSIAAGLPDGASTVEVRDDIPWSVELSPSREDALPVELTLDGGGSVIVTAGSGWARWDLLPDGSVPDRVREVVTLVVFGRGTSDGKTLRLSAEDGETIVLGSRLGSALRRSTPLTPYV
jgi:hypothetical protein